MDFDAEPAPEVPAPEVPAQTAGRAPPEVAGPPRESGAPSAKAPRIPSTPTPTPTAKGERPRTRPPATPVPPTEARRPPPQAPTPPAKPPRSPIKTQLSPRPATPAAGEPAGASEATPVALLPQAAATDREPFIAQAHLLIRDWQAEIRGKPDLFRAVRLHYEIGRLYDNPLGDLERAAAAYQRSLGLSAEFLPALVAARRVLLTQGEHAKALPLFDAEIKLSGDPKRKAALTHAKGRVLEEALGRRDDARAAYAAALEFDPGEVAILKAIERIDHQAKSWRGLEQVYAKIASAVEVDPLHRAAVIIRRAHLFEGPLGDLRAAVELYENALTLDPKAISAYAALKRLHHGQSRWRELIHVLGREAEQTSDREVRALAHYRIARLHSERLGNRDLAIAALERAVAEAPHHRLILEELIALYQAAGRFDAMAAELERMIALVEAPRERIALLYRLGELHEGPLADEDTAIRWYEASLAAEPAFLPGLRALTKLYTAREAWDALIAINLGEAEAVRDSVRRAAAHHRVATIFEAHKEDREAAIEHHARALTLDPELAGSFKALVRLYSQAGRHHPLIELYERGIDGAANDTVRIAYLFQIGDLLLGALDEPQQAIHTFRRILKLDPDHLGAIHALQRAAEQAGRPKELAAALELEASKTREPARVIVLLHRAATILGEELDEPQAALALLRRILEISSTYQPALASAGRLYYHLSRWEDLYRTYEQELAVTEPGPAAVALLQTMGELAETKLGRVEQAIECYRRAIKADAKHQPSFEALGRLLTADQRWRELVNVLETQLAGLTSPPARAAAAYRVGRVYEERLGLPDKALAAYLRAVEAVADFRPAVDGIARVHALQEQWSGIVEDLEREATTARDPRLAIAAHLRAGEIWSEHLRQPEKAIASYEAVLTADPENLAALLALEPLYREAEGWTMLAEVYGRQSQILREPRAKIAALHQLAAIQAAHGDDPEATLATYAAILELDPHDAGALQATEGTALAAGDDELLTWVDQRLVESPLDRSLRAAHHSRLGESRERVGDLEGALAAYQAAVADDANSLAALYGILRVASTADQPQALVDAKLRLAELERDGAVAAELMTAIAILRLQRLDDHDGTIAALEEALDRSPDHHRAAELLDEILRAIGRTQALVERLSQAAGAASPTRASELWCRVAELYANELDNPAAGIAALRRSLGERPTHGPTNLLLGDLLGHNQQWSEAAEAYRAALAVTTDGGIQAAANTSLAEILAEHLDDLAGARAAMAAALAARPDDRDALLRITDYHARAGDIDAAAEAARQLLRVSTTREQRLGAIIHLFHVELTLGRREQAREVLLNAVVLEGPGGESATIYCDFASDPEDWRRYEAALTKHLRQVEGDSSAAVPVYLALAEVAADRLGSTAKAITTLEQALASVGESAALRVALGRQLEAEERYPEAIRTYKQLLQHHPASSPGWRGLYDSYMELDRQLQATLTIAPLCILGAASEYEARVMQSSIPRPPTGEPGSLLPDNCRPLVDRSDRGAVAERLLAIIEPSLARLYPMDVNAYGISSRDRLTSRSNHPLRNLADRIAGIFAIADFEMYIIHTQGLRILHDFGALPAILVPASVLRINETQQVFVLARALADVARGLHPLSKFKAQDLMLILAAAARSADANYGSTLADGNALSELNRRIVKALSRKDRRAFEEVAAAYASAPPLDFPAWVRDNTFAAHRVACMITGDLGAAVEVIRQEDPALGYLEGEELVRNSAVIADLLRYWCSDAAFELRRRMATARPAS